MEQWESGGSGPRAASSSGSSGASRRSGRSRRRSWRCSRRSASPPRSSWVGGRILSGELEAGKFFSFVAAVLLLYQPVKQLGRVGQTAIFGAASGERIFEILDAPSPRAGRGHGERLPPFAREIRFENGRVHVRLLPRARGPRLHRPPGRGGGAGRRLGVREVHRREPPAAVLGRHRRADHDRRRGRPRRDTREPPRPDGDRDAGDLLFNDTVRANIAYGRPDVSAADVERAARMAQAHDFIVALPQGYDTGSASAACSSPAASGSGSPSRARS